MNVLDSYSRMNPSALQSPHKEKISSVGEAKTPKKINKKKLACSVAAAVGVAAIAAGGIYFAVKKGRLQKPLGTAQNVSNTESSVSQKVKQFLNKDGIVEDVTLQKGRAIKKDGSMFSGVMKTVNGKGQEVAIEYNEGFMTQSSINGKLFKKFENIDGLTRNQGVQITQFFDKGKKSQTLITNYDNGKAKRIYKTPDIGNNRSLEPVTAVEFTKDGKIAAKAQYNWGNVLQQAQIFDENGKVIREIGLERVLENSNNGGFVERIYDKNGILKIRRLAADNYYQYGTGTDPRTLMLSEHKLYEPNSIKYYDAEGKMQKGLLVKSGKSGNKISLFDKDNSTVLRVNEQASELSNTYTMQINDEEDILFNLGSRGFRLWRNRKDTSPQELSEQIQKAADNLEEAYDIIKKEGMPYRTGKDINSGMVHIDIPNVIKQMREFIGNMVSE